MAIPGVYFLYHLFSWQDYLSFISFIIGRQVLCILSDSEALGHSLWVNQELTRTLEGAYEPNETAAPAA